MGRGLSPGHVLHCFLLALHTNLAADEAKLGVWCCARTVEGTTKPVQPVYGATILNGYAIGGMDPALVSLNWAVAPYNWPDL